MSRTGDLKDFINGGQRIFPFMSSKVLMNKYEYYYDFFKLPFPAKDVEHGLRYAMTTTTQSKDTILIVSLVELAIAVLGCLKLIVKVVQETLKKAKECQYILRDIL